MRFFVFFIFLFSSLSFAASDEAILGKAEGYPVCPLPTGPTEERCLVGMLSHYDEIVPARKVAKPAAPRALKRIAREPILAYTWRDKPETLESFLARSRDTGLLVMQGDTILVERYQYDRKPEMRFQSYSMAKTVVGMLVGIAIADGKIASIDDKAEKYVPALKGHPYGETSLRHLLTMSSGIKFSEENYDATEDIAQLGRKTLYQQGPGGADSVLGFTQRAAPAGTHFNYSSAESEVLGLVLRAATGKTLAEYLSEKIWQPMGAEADATWLIDGGGYELGYMGINATLRDWGRLGMLLANDGALDGKQIIPAAWVKAATTVESPHLQVGVATRNNGYGYQTWIINPRERMFALLGLRGQAVMIDPATKVVVVHTAVLATDGGPLRGDQFGLFYGVVNSLKQQ
ncbi:MAG TPA: serine hydrolase [Burkholderiales bacterium]|nr:serine hydrolase [Burkholderiales bacterium]